MMRALAAGAAASKLPEPEPKVYELIARQYLMQFYPAASLPEQAVHPGLLKRQQGILDSSTLSGPGFGYRIDEIERELPDPVA